MKFVGVCKTRGFCRGKSLLAGLLIFEQIATHQLLQKLIAVELADHTAGIVIVRNIGGIFREDISYDLVDGIVALFIQCVEHSPQNTVHIVFFVTGNCELDGIFRHETDLLGMFGAYGVIIAQK
jgi:hypothetical protein